MAVEAAQIRLIVKPGIITEANDCHVSASIAVVVTSCRRSAGVGYGS